MESFSVNGLNEIPTRYHHFFLGIEGLDFVEYTDSPELRFTLYFYDQNKIIFWYNNRIETRDACSIINPPCHIRENLRQKKIAFCKNGIKEIQDSHSTIIPHSKDIYDKKSLCDMRIEICRLGIISKTKN